MGSPHTVLLFISGGKMKKNVLKALILVIFAVICLFAFASCGLMNNTTTVTSVSFEEPAEWVASDGTTRLTEAQCNDGTSALYSFNQASTRYDLSWTKTVDAQ